MSAKAFIALWLFAEGSGDGVGPAGLERRSVGAGGLKDMFGLPLGLDFVEGGPEADGEAGEVAGAHGRGFGDLRTDDGGVQDIGLELHHEVVAGGAAVDLQFGEPDAGVFLHRADDVHRLERDAFERRPGDVRRRGPAGDAADGAMGILVPVGRAHAGEGGDEIDAAVVRDRRGEGLDLGGTPDDAEAVAEPLDDGTAYEDGAFQRVIDLVANLPGDGGEEVVAGEDGLFARVHQEEAAGAVGVLDGAGLGAHLAEEGRLLVARDTADGDLMGEDGGLRDAVDLGAGTDLGHHRRRDVQQRQELGIPLQRVDIEQHRAGGVGDVGHMDLAAGELPDEPGVHGAEAELARLGLLAGAGHVVQDPADLGAGEVGVDDEACLLTDEIGLVPEGVAELGGAAVLPDDGVIHGFARLGVPDDGGLPLVGDADAGDALAVDAHLGDGLGDDGGLGGPDLHRIVLHPPRLREILGELHLRGGSDVPFVVEDDGPGRTRPLVQGQDVFFHNYVVGLFSPKKFVSIRLFDRCRSFFFCPRYPMPKPLPSGKGFTISFRLQ